MRNSLKILLALFLVIGLVGAYLYDPRPEQHEVSVTLDYRGGELSEVPVKMRGGQIRGDSRVEEAEIPDGSFELGELESTEVATFTTEVKDEYNLTLDMGVVSSSEAARENDVREEVEFEKRTVTINGDTTLNYGISVDEREDYNVLEVVG